MKVVGCYKDLYCCLESIRVTLVVLLNPRVEWTDWSVHPAAMYPDRDV